MNYSLIDWIDSAKSTRKVIQRKIGWINSQGKMSDAIRRSEKNGTQWIKTETHLILSHSDKLTVGFNESNVAVVQGNEIIVRNRIPLEKIVTRIPSSSPPKLLRLNAVKLKPPANH